MTARRAVCAIRRAVACVFPVAAALEIVRDLPAKPGTGRQAKAWLAFDQAQAHPGHGLTPEAVVTIFRAAERGALARQCDLFDDVIENDGHLRSLINSRVAAVSGKEYVIQPGAPDDASVRAAEQLQLLAGVDDLGLSEWFEHEQGGIFYGYAAAEIEWQIRRGFVAPARLHCLPARRFTMHGGTSLRLMTEARPTGEQLLPGQWVVHRRKHANLARAGLMRTAVWWSLFKRMSMADWVVFAERYGLPFAIGKYDAVTNSPDARAKLEEALQQIGDDGYAIMEKGCEIAFSEASSSSTGPSVHGAICDRADAEMAKLIAGATLTQDSGGPGSFALGQVHESREFSLAIADAVRIASDFRRDIAVPFLAYNGYPEGTAPPKLKIQLTRDLDAKTRAEVAAIVVNELGASIDAQPVLDELGFRRAEGDEALPGTRTSISPAPAEPAPVEEAE